MLQVCENFDRVDSNLNTSIANKFDEMTRTIKATITQSCAPKDAASVGSFKSLLSKIASEAQEVTVAQRILQSLKFDAMHHRRAGIAKTFEKTYEWIYLPEEELEAKRGVQVRFQEWLRTGSGIYWISGKAGSGKSTLMKFLASNVKTHSALDQWKGTGKLVTASFFFYYYGSNLERTQIGLFKALLFEILQVCPDMMESLCPERWSADEHNKYRSDSWELEELSGMMDRLRSQPFRSDGFERRFCFFLDGLDEYDGDHNDIITVLNRMSSSEHIKIVASSRPWNVFQIAFGQHKDKMLTLQELTFGDIHQYVEGNLFRDYPSALLGTDEDARAEIAQEVTEKAQGVFLWVYLAVKELRKSFQNGDSLFDVRRRLKRIPPQLEKYFRRMFDTIEDFYREQAVQIFLVCTRSPERLYLAALAELESNDPLAKRFCSNEDFSADDLQRLHKQLAIRVNARCLDLLEINGHHPAPGVVFLHRTVADFLGTKDILDMMLQWAGTNFDPLMSLCKMQALIIKRQKHLMPAEFPQKVNYAFSADLLARLFSYSAEMELVQLRTPCDILDGIHNISSYQALNLVFHTFHELQFDALTEDATSLFLNLCVVYELSIYLSLWQRRNDNLRPSVKGKLLCTAVDNICQISNKQPERQFPRTAQIVELLMANGIVPCTPLDLNSNVWECFLSLLAYHFTWSGVYPSNSIQSVLLSIAEGLMCKEAECGTPSLTRISLSRLGQGGPLDENKILSWCFGSCEAARLASIGSPATPSSHSRSSKLLTTFKPSWWPL